MIGVLEYLQSDKKIKTLTDTAELIEDAVHAATMEQVLLLCGPLLDLFQIVGFCLKLHFIYD